MSQLHDSFVASQPPEVRALFAMPTGARRTSRATDLVTRTGALLIESVHVAGETYDQFLIQHPDQATVPSWAPNPSVTSKPITIVRDAAKMIADKRPMRPLLVGFRKIGRDLNGQAIYGEGPDASPHRRGRSGDVLAFDSTAYTVDRSGMADIGADGEPKSIDPAKLPEGVEAGDLREFVYRVGQWTEDGNFQPFDVQRVGVSWHLEHFFVQAGVEGLVADGNE